MQNPQLQISAPIIPGRSAAGIVLGTAIGQIPAAAAGLFRPSYYASPALPDGFVIRHRSPSLELWESAGVVVRIIVREGYTGLVEGTIGIGSTLEELEEIAGEMEVMEDGTILPPGIPGISFMAESSPSLADPEAPASAIITLISIFPAHRAF